MCGIPLMVLWLGNHAACSLSPRLRLAPLHSNYCSCRHAVNLASPKCLGLQCNGATRSGRFTGTLALLLGVKPQLLSVTSSNSWGFYFSWGYTVTAGLSWPLTARSLSYSPTRLMPSKLRLLGNLHFAQFGSLWTAASVYLSHGSPSQNTLLQWCCSPLNHGWLVGWLVCS